LEKADSRARRSGSSRCSLFDGGDLLIERRQFARHRAPMSRSAWRNSSALISRSSSSRRRLAEHGPFFERQSIGFVVGALQPIGGA
jgi:hypothetical protein